MSLFHQNPSSQIDSPQERRALVALTIVHKVGHNRVRSLLARFGSATAALAASEPALAKTDGVGGMVAEAIASFDKWALVDEALDRAERCGAAFVPAHSDEFPASLRRLTDAPAGIWVRGRLDPEDARAVAVVGSRKASAYGLRVAEHFAEALVEAGFTVVSGLAYGVDIAAHRAALRAGGRTIAVLGSGVDRIYPSVHSGDVRRILETDSGAIVSEFLPGADPDAPNFPKRNRLISGLSLGTLVAESRASGGALLTAFFALEQNREVFAAPMPLFQTSGEGNNRLIQQGAAKLVCTIDDLLVELGSVDAPKEMARPQRVAFAPAESLGLAPEEEALLSSLDAEPQHLDKLCASAGVDPAAALGFLLGLEFKGLVRQIPGRQFLRT